MSSPGGRIIAVASDSDGITADIRAIKERVVEMNARLAKLEGTPAPAPAKAAKSSPAPSADGSGNNIATSGRGTLWLLPLPRSPPVPATST